MFYDKVVELSLTFQFLAGAECIVKDHVLHFQYCQICRGLVSQFVEKDVMIKSATVLPAKSDSDVMFVYIVIRDL